MIDLWTGHGQIAILLLALAFGLGLIVLAVWIALPFGIFGTKPLLRELIAAHRETNKKLEEIRRLIADLGARWPPL